jgi:uncharacterized protein with FMN-binding domain
MPFKISKRFALIVGGTLGGFGAVLSITPPQFGSSGGISGGSLSGGSLSGSSLSGSNAATTTTTTTPAAVPATPAAVPTTPTPAATTTAKKKSKKKAASTTNSSNSTSSSNVTTPQQNATPTPAVPVAPTKTTSGASGTFTGASINTRFGPVQVQITVANGRITNVTAPQYPTESFRDQQINAQAIPWLEQETISAQSANIQGVGGASYTSEGFYQSLVSALSKAGM